MCKYALGRATGVSRHLQTTGAGAGSAGYGQGRAAGAEEVYGFSPAGVLTTIAATTPETDGTAPSAAVAVSAVGGVAVPAGGGDARVEFSGTMPTRVGRTTYTYDAAGRVTRTVTKRISRKPLVRNFYYATGEQPIGFDSSDAPGVGWRYVYDGLGRRVAKETVANMPVSMIEARVP